MKKKILFIQPDCRSYRIPLFEKLSNEYEVSILHFGKKAFRDNDRVKEIFFKKYQLLSLIYIRGLSRLCSNYDLIIAVFDLHWINSFFLPVLINRPVIFWGHGIGQSKIVSYLRKVVGEKAVALLTYDENGKNELINLGLDHDKVFVAPNTIFVTNSENFSMEKKNAIVFVGRLQRRKELEILIKSFAIIQKKIPQNTVLNIIGNGDEVLNELKEMVIELNLKDKVLFIDGTTDDKELANYFRNAYCYTSPGAVGLGIMHSFAYGVPVITFRNRKHGPEASNIIHKENGILVDDGVQNYSEAIFNIIDSGIYKELGNNAFEYYSNSRTINHMIQGFKKAIDYSI